MNKLMVLLFAAILIFLITGCKKESSSPTAPTPTENYFPSTEGTNYKYSYQRIDSSGQINGTRITHYKGSRTIQGTAYKIQIDSLIVSSFVGVDSSYFRTAVAGVYYFLDTTGLAASIEDSTLMQFLPFILVDKELLAYSVPIQVGGSWTAFKMNLNYPGLPLTTLVDLSANAASKETISLNLVTGNVNKEAVRIRFILTLRTNPLSGVTQTFTADAWLVKDIGPVKWDGSGTIVNFFTGLGIDFADTSVVVKQSLIDYQIK